MVSFRDGDGGYVRRLKNSGITDEIGREGGEGDTYVTYRWHVVAIGTRVHRRMFTDRQPVAVITVITDWRRGWKVPNRRILSLFLRLVSNLSIRYRAFDTKYSHVFVLPCFKFEMTHDNNI